MQQLQDTQTNLENGNGAHDEAPIHIKQPPILFDQTQHIIREIETGLGGPLLVYWNNHRGCVCHSDVLAMYELLERLGKHERMHLFIKSDGGNGQAALRIVNLIRQYCDQLVALVPLECASAATMVALGANEIHMGPLAYLTAVDTSLTHDLSPLDRDNNRVSVSLDELNRVVKLWHNHDENDAGNPYQSLFDHVHPLVIGAVDRAESLSIKICTDLLSYHVENRDQAIEIANTLNSRFPSHSFPILIKEASEMGLNVKQLPKELNGQLLQLNEIYSEMGQKATTDFDETRAHSNEIINISEVNGQQVHYQQDKDWFYRSSERRWITLNDESSWHKVEHQDGQIRRSVLHIS